MASSGIQTPRRNKPVSRGRARLPHLVERDVHTCAGLLAQGKGAMEIIQHFSSRKPAPSGRRVREWISRARRRWVADHADELPTIRESTLTWMRSQRDWCKRNGHPAQMAKYDDMIAKTLGLYDEKHLHLHQAQQGPAQAAPAVNWRGVTDEGLDAAEAALRAAQGPLQLVEHVE